MATTVTLKPNAIDISGATSGTTTLQATAVAGTTTITLPAATDTLVGKATTDTLTNKTLTSPTISGGTVNNASVGATTPASGAFTTLSATGVTTVQAGTVSLPAITTSGDTNTGIFFPAADTIAFTKGGAEAMRLDSAGNVGIGATAPTQKLDVLSTANSANTIAIRNTDTTTATYSTQSYLRLEVAGNHIGGLKSTARNLGGLSTPALFLTTAGAYPIAFGLNDSATPAMVLDTGGNLGLGVTPSAWGSGKALELSNGVSLFANTGAAASYLFTNSFFNGTSFIYKTTNLASYYNQQNGIHAWAIAPSGTAGNAITFTQAMTLSAAGNLGIGTTSPGTYTLHISNATPTVRISGTSETAAQTQSLFFGTTTYNRSEIRSINVGTQGADLTFLTSPTGASSTERMRIDSTGNLLVGTTSASVADGGADNLVVGPGTGNNGITVYSANTGNANLNFADTDSPTVGFIQYQHNGNNMLFQTNGSERARIDSSGNLLVTQTSAGLSATGGIQLRNNAVASSILIGHQTGVATGNSFAEFGYAGSLIGSITQSGTTAVLFNITSDQRLKQNIQDADDAASLVDALQVRKFDWKADGTHQRYGFIAQELVTVAPEAVHQPANPDDMMAVDYSKLVPMLVKEIQDLRKRLAAANL